MENLKLEIRIEKYRLEELNQMEQNLISSAKDATQSSYAPYSGFNVGAAVLLDDETIVKGSNQENAAYPSGLCAERTALFYANSQYPAIGVRAMAIAARNSSGFTKEPITPCGSCRQVILETEKRFGHQITFYLYGEDYIYKIEGTRNLLPLSFGNDFL